MWYVSGFLLIEIVNGLKLPGDCPIMPPIQNKDLNESQYQLIIGQIPFSQTESYLFRKIPRGHLSRFNLMMDLNTSRISVLNGAFQPKLMANLIKESPRNITFETYVRELPSLGESQEDTKLRSIVCNPLLNETISYWITGYLGVYYSCRKLDRGFHDVAVLVTYRSNNLPETTEEVQNEYNRLALADIPDGIIWGDLPIVSENEFNVRSLYPCRLNSGGVNFFIIVVTMPFLAISILLFAYQYLKKLYRTQVHPVRLNN